MLDIETLGTDPGAVILSIAAVEFDLESGKTGREYLWKIDIKDSMKHGFVIDPDTLLWWVGQNPEVFKSNILPDGLTLPIKPVVEDIINVFKYALSPKIHVWGNSNRFDMGILIPYLRVITDKPIWKYSNERDVRTLVSFNPFIKGEVVEKAKKDNLDLHNPIIDCKLQIEYCSKIYNSIITTAITVKNTACGMLSSSITGLICDHCGLHRSEHI